MDPGAPTPGEVATVDACPDVHYVDTGMYDVAGYGAAYLVDAERPALVETGIGTHRERVLGLLEATGVAPEELGAILLTHVHLDHAGGAGFLAEACPDAGVYVHEVGAPHLVDPARLVEGTKRAVGEMWRHYVEPEPVPADRVVELTDGDAVDLGDRRLVAHHAPGHAPHQVVFEAPWADAVFTGDAAGIYAPSMDRVEPTTPPPNFDLEAALADVETLEALDPATLLYTHFGSRTGDAAAALAGYRETLLEWVAHVESLAAAADDEAVIERLRAETDMAPAWGEAKARAEAELNARGALRYLATTDA